MSSIFLKLEIRIDVNELKNEDKFYNFVSKTNCIIMIVINEMIMFFFYFNYWLKKRNLIVFDIYYLFKSVNIINFYIKNYKWNNKIKLCKQDEKNKKNKKTQKKMHIFYQFKNFSY